MEQSINRRRVLLWDSGDGGADLHLLGGLPKAAPRRLARFASPLFKVVALSSMMGCPKRRVVAVEAELRLIVDSDRNSAVYQKTIATSLSPYFAAKALGGSAN